MRLSNDLEDWKRSRPHSLALSAKEDWKGARIMRDEEGELQVVRSDADERNSQDLGDTIMDASCGLSRPHDCQGRAHEKSRASCGHEFWSPHNCQARAYQKPREPRVTSCGHEFRNPWQGRTHAMSRERMIRNQSHRRNQSAGEIGAEILRMPRAPVGTMGESPPSARKPPTI